MKLQLYVNVFMWNGRFSQEIGGNTLLGISLGEGGHQIPPLADCPFLGIDFIQFMACLSSILY